MSDPAAGQPVEHLAHADDLTARTRAAFVAGGALPAAFEGFVAREQQIELAGFVAQALQDAATVVAEAGTGVGKTFAYLVPALLGEGRVVVSSGTRTLQDQLFGRDLPALQRALGTCASVALLKGRANYVCRHHLRRNLENLPGSQRELAAPLHRIAWFARRTASGDRADCADVADDAPAWALATSTRDNCLGQDCADWNECFVVQARRAAQSADVVVVNHHLFCADLALRDEGISELLPSANAVVFDEAHLLPEVGSLFFGEALSARQVADLAGDAGVAGLTHARDAADWPRLADAAHRAARELRAAWPAASGRLDADALLADAGFGQAADRLHDGLRRLQAALATAAVRHPDLARCAQRADMLCERLQAWLDTATPADVGRDEADDTAGDDAPVCWGEAHAHAVTLHRTPVSVAAPFSRQRDATRCAWVFVSATLALGGDFGPFTRALGLADAICRQWPSPFDYARQARLYVPTGCGDTQQPGFTDCVVARVWPLLQANRGRAFVLCTSLRAVRRVAELLRERLARAGSVDAAGSTARTGVDGDAAADNIAQAPQPGELTLLVQGELARAELLRRFRQARAPVLVGAASFWQGVDVQGEQLSLVVIDKLPFASPDDPVLQARMRALRRAGRDPFSELQLPAAAVALKQGAGRLLRSERDRGVLVVGDERLLTKPYGRRLRASLPPFPVIRDEHEAVEFLLRPPLPDSAASRPCPDAGSRQPTAS